MKRILSLAVVLILVGAVGFGWYFLYGPVQGLKVHPRGASAVSTASAAEVEPLPAEVEAPPSPTIAVVPSEEVIENFPATITVRDGAKSFVAKYTGQFRRNKKFIIAIDTYDIASYVVEPANGETLELLDGLLVDGKAKVYMLRFVNGLPGRQIMNDIYNEINTSFTDVDLERLQESVDNFCTQFKNGSKPGDIVYIVWLPEGKVYSAFNSADSLTFLAQDVPFARALWRIWAGPRRGDIRFNLVRRYADGKNLK